MTVKDVAWKMSRLIVTEQKPCTMEKLRLIHGNASLAEFLIETLDFPENYHLSSGNVDEEVSK